ncbi:SBBP repeat-containing protein [Persicitalea jodogahamensis]|uniref:T9SS type A sorting domain-containing protein n=1 Tax=Persicitalea jodogahamensis TaxID=402147 RepID=A0A8J3D6M2_9BACT|nr:SBBP repeat-containing protein [Persicitalea jodogahamensis]GHB57833.1 hypothetical protein GCM10007390_09080 [Persicitalea jodogahamensis]
MTQPVLLSNTNICYRKGRTLVLLILLTCAFVPADAQQYVWATRMGGSTSDDIGNSVAVDASGNTYTTGFFQGTADFGPFELTAAGSSTSDAFVTKQNTAGEFQWALRIGAADKPAEGFSIAVDAAGNSYVIGRFDGSITLGTTTLSDATGEAFVAKLNTSGEFQWAKAFDVGFREVRSGIAVNSSGVYLTGYFSGTASLGSTSLIAAGSEDIFVSKLDPSDGSPIWAVRWGGTGRDQGRSIVLDGANAYVTGYFQGTDADFGSATFVSNGLADIFVAKLNTATGSLTWVKQIGGSRDDVGHSVAVDGSGNVYTTGYFSEEVDFDPGSGEFELSSPGIEKKDIFISKLNSSGNFVWARQLGGSLDDEGNSLALDASNNVFVTGSFRSTADFDPGAGAEEMTSAGSKDIFIAKLTSAGALAWARRVGAGGDDVGNSIVVTSLGIHTTGAFRGTVDFDPNAGTAELTAGSGEGSSGSGGRPGDDIFVLKLLECVNPTAYAVSGGGPSCAGSTGVAIGLAGSQTGVNYQLQKDNADQGDPVPGTGQGLSFGNQTEAGTYTVVATNASTSCAVDMTGSASVTVNSLPAAVVSGGGTVCAGETPPDVSIALTGAAPFTFTYSDGTGSNTITSTSDNPYVLSPAPAGTYTVTALTDANGCAGTSLAGSVTVTVNPLPIVTPGPDQSVILGFGSNCTDISAMATGAAPLSYSWDNGAGTGATVNVCPETTTTFEVTVTDGNSCTSLPAQVTVSVQDLRCGNRQQNVTICYYGVTQCVSEKIAKRYLKLGATIGGCGSSAGRIGVEESSELPLQLSLKAYPNPVLDAVTVEVLSRMAGSATFEVLDVTGRSWQTRTEPLVEGLNELNFRMGSLPTGIYLIKAVDEMNQQSTVRVSKE